MILQTLKAGLLYTLYVKTIIAKPWLLLSILEDLICKGDLLLLCGQVPESREMLIITRISMGVITLGALLLALFVPNIYDFWGFTVTLVYVIVFPQLLAVIFFSFANGR